MPLVENGPIEVGALRAYRDEQHRKLGYLYTLRVSGSLRAAIVTMPAVKTQGRPMHTTAAMKLTDYQQPARVVALFDYFSLLSSPGFRQIDADHRDRDAN